MGCVVDAWTVFTRPAYSTDSRSFLKSSSATTDISSTISSITPTMIPTRTNSVPPSSSVTDRRHALEKIAHSATAVSTAASIMISLPWRAARAAMIEEETAVTTTTTLLAAEEAGGGMPDRFNVDDYLRSGLVANPMGVSGQAGKSRPEIGVVLREGSEVQRDASGNVLAELLLVPSSSSSSSFASSSSSSSTLTTVVASFRSPWPLATGSVFDVECRDPKTGDGAFLQVSTPLNLNDNASNTLLLSDSFLVKQLIAPTGRFSFYGAPTDVKVKHSSAQGAYRIVDVSFSIISQSTQTELPRQARIVATVPNGTNQAVMLVASASALRWRKGIDQVIDEVSDSFRAIPAPTTQLKVRAKAR